MKVQAKAKKHFIPAALVAAVFFLPLLIFIRAPAAESPLHLADVEKLVLDMTNEERQKNGLSPLKPDPDLSQAAGAYCRDMLTRDFFSHTNPEGLSFSDRVGRAHRSLIGTVGENLGLLAGGERRPMIIARHLVEGWMNSPGHRANILNPRYTHIGLGGYRYYKQIRGAQLFARVAAYIDRPVRYKTAKGTRLDLSASGGTAPSGEPSRVRLRDLGSNQVVLGPVPVDEVKLDVKRGEYRLEFFVHENSSGQGNYEIFKGPEIKIY